MLQTIQAQWASQVVQCIKPDVEGLGVNTPDWLPLLGPSLDILTRSGTIISAHRFTPGTIHEMQESARGFVCKVSLEKKTVIEEEKYLQLKKEVDQSGHA